MTIAIAAGSRHLHVGHAWWPELDAKAEAYKITELWHGGAKGADEGVAVWARARGLTVEPFPAPWDLFKKAGLNQKAAGARRIDDMLSGRREYVLAHSEHDPEAIDGIVTTQQLGSAEPITGEVAGQSYGIPRPNSPASVLFALPGYAGTRRTIRAAAERGLITERIQIEPWVINRWHYRRPDGTFELPPSSVDIQRGTALGNPFRVGDPLGTAGTVLGPLDKLLGCEPNLNEPITGEQCLEFYRAWLWREMHRKDRGVLAMLRRISAKDHLVCTCKRPDGTGLCHGDVVVRAWRFVHAKPELDAHHSSR